MKKLLPLLLLLGLAGCSQEPADTLQITSFLQGEKVRSLEAVCDSRCRKSLQKVRLQPVPPGTPCTRIYGGPEEIQIEGEVRGSRVMAEFNRQGGCEMERFDSLQPLLRAIGISYSSLFPGPRV